MLNEQSNERVLFSGYAKLPVGITAAELLHKKIQEETKETAPKIYDIKVQYRF